MIIQKGLTKENFFDSLRRKYPRSFKHFCNWIDEYKKEVCWDKLFKANEDTDQLHSSTYKFHEIPYAMQYGIWIAFCRDQLHRFFEQPEHVAEFVDMEEDIRGVFALTEELIDNEEN